MCHWYDVIVFTDRSIWVKIKYGHIKISVPKICISISQTACIKPCYMGVVFY